MTTDLFVDTSGWASYFDRSQPSHTAAGIIYRRALTDGRRFVTTNYVLIELVALLTRPLNIPRQTLLAFVDALRAAPHVEIVHVSPELDKRGWGLLKSRADKAWSLVDAVSFVVMQDRGLSEALSTDHHFEQAGFTRLLKP